MKRSIGFLVKKGDLKSLESFVSMLDKSESINICAGAFPSYGFEYGSSCDVDSIIFYDGDSVTESENMYNHLVSIRNQDDSHDSLEVFFNRFNTKEDFVNYSKYFSTDMLVYEDGKIEVSKGYCNLQWAYGFADKLKDYIGKGYIMYVYFVDIQESEYVFVAECEHYGDFLKCATEYLGTGHYDSNEGANSIRTYHANPESVNKMLTHFIEQASECKEVEVVQSPLDTFTSNVSTILDCLSDSSVYKHLADNEFIVSFRHSENSAWECYDKYTILTNLGNVYSINTCDFVILEDLSNAEIENVGKNYEYEFKKSVEVSLLDDIESLILDKLKQVRDNNEVYSNKLVLDDNFAGCDMGCTEVYIISDVLSDKPICVGIEGNYRCYSQDSITAEIFNKVKSLL